MARWITVGGRARCVRDPVCVYARVCGAPYMQASAAAAAAPPLTRAEQIQAKKAEQRARVAAFAQTKKNAEAAKAAEVRAHSSHAGA